MRAASESVTIRFPNGAWEYRVGEAPNLGDTYVRQGKRFVVVAVTRAPDAHHVVTTALAPDQADA